MPRSPRRQAALTFCLAAIGLACCLFVWACILTFDSADSPGTTAWPPNSVPANACGQVGAIAAHHLFWQIGLGVYPLMVFATAAVIAKMRLAALNDLWLRFFGVALIVSAFSTAGSMFASLFDASRWTLAGPGGVLGMVAAYHCQLQFQTMGTLFVLACAFLVGIILAADEWVMAFARLLGWARQRSASVIVRGSNVITGGAGGLVTAPLVTTGDVPSIPAEELRSGGRLGSLAPRNVARADSPAVVEPPTVIPTKQSGSGDRTRQAQQTARQLPLDVERDLEAPPPPENVSIRARTGDAQPLGGGIAASPAGSTAAGTPPPAKAGFIPDPKERFAAEPSDPVVRQMAPAPQHGKLTDGKPLARPFTLPSGEEYKLPPVSLLEDPTPIDKESVEILCREKAYILEQTLNEFRLEVKVVAIETGPVITVFELKLAPGIKVSQIVSLSNDMARALKAPAVRVVAPLPGKNTIGIEVPNIDKEKVRLKDLMRAGTKAASHAIPLFLGKDAAGQPVVADLTQMPHLLIAGTTGSGKSICVSSVVMSVLLTRTPSEVQMILVDPKVVELSIFKEIPHLMCPIVTEASKAEGILDWAATKMDERYALLAEAGVKDIRGYNRLGREGLRDRFAPITDEELDKIPQFLPYIVIVIDELADLMMTSAKEVEFYLCRLAQKSRAVGIHLIVSTQRPQANVVTGLIKSNLPCRIAFRVSSRLDSRIVLDQNGGEVLLGQGDMLYLPPGSSKLVRAQGTFISDDELRSVVKHACAQAKPQFHPELVRMPGAGLADGERDELFDTAVGMIIESGRGSVSLLQRRLEVGYSRASRLIDQMYAAGIVGEYKGSQAREVLMTREEWDKIKAVRDSEEAAEAAAEDNPA